jgi:hypothetical protein
MRFHILTQLIMERILMSKLEQTNSNNESLVTAFMSVYHEEKKQREKQKSKRKLEARRYIEQYIERKQLQRDLEEYWSEAG